MAPPDQSRGWLWLLVGLLPLLGIVAACRSAPQLAAEPHQLGELSVLLPDRWDVVYRSRSLIASRDPSTPRGPVLQVAFRRQPDDALPGAEASLDRLYQAFGGTPIDRRRQTMADGFLEVAELRDAGLAVAFCVARAGTMGSVEVTLTATAQEFRGLDAPGLVRAVAESAARAR